MKKGFTLIELLAVIIILAVIALITTPIVLDVVESAKKSSFESTAYGVMDAVRLKTIENRLENETLTNEYVLPSDVIEIQGQQPDGGVIRVDNNGRIEMAVYNDKWCASKKYKDGTITLTEYNQDTCRLSEYYAGEYLKIKVNESNTYNFYVLSETNETVTLILDRNLGDNSAWASQSAIETQEQLKGVDYETLSAEEKIDFLNELGPVTAQASLNQLTSTWSYPMEVRLPSAYDILEHIEFYQNLNDKSNWKEQYYNKYYTKLESMIPVEEFKGCEGEEECRKLFKQLNIADTIVPKWLAINLYKSGDDTLSNGKQRLGYLTTELYQKSDFVGVYNVVSDGPLVTGNLGPTSVVGYPYGLVLEHAGIQNVFFNGIRPVITIDKEYIVEKLTNPIYVNDELGQ